MLNFNYQVGDLVIWDDPINHFNHARLNPQEVVEVGLDLLVIEKTTLKSNTATVHKRNIIPVHFAQALILLLRNNPKPKSANKQWEIAVSEHLVRASTIGSRLAPSPPINTSTIIRHSFQSKEIVVASTRAKGWIDVLVWAYQGISVDSICQKFQLTKNTQVC